MAKHRIYTTSFASVYPLYVAKAEKKGRTKAEVDRVISWLTGYGQKELETQLEKQTDFETFFAKAPKINPSRALIKGVVCGVRVEDIKEPTMREIRYLDKLIDELAQGKAMDKILRKNDSERPAAMSAFYGVGLYVSLLALSGHRRQHVSWPELVRRGSQESLCVVAPWTRRLGLCLAH